MNRRASNTGGWLHVKRLLKFTAIAVAGLIGSGLMAAGNDGAKISPELLTDAYVPLVVVGDGWSQQIVIQNLDEEEAITGTLKFFTEGGDPWPVELVGRGTADTFFVTLFPGQMAMYETVPKFNTLLIGYAHIDTDCCPRSLIQTIFRRQETNRPDFMTSMAIEEDSFRSVHLLFDNRGGKFAGVGILTTRSCFSFSCETVMDLTFRDEFGNVIVQDRKTQRNGTLWWFSLSVEYPQVIGKVGSMEVTSGDPESEFLFAVGVSLQFAPNGAFTAVTAAERRPRPIQ